MEVFDIVNQYDNDRLSSMSNKDLYLFKACLKKYLLDLREELDLSKNITFGVEIEVDKIKKGVYELGRDKYYLNKDWIFKGEETLLIGREVISPVLKDCKDTWKIINEILSDLGECSEISAYCGGHIHFGSQILGTNKQYYYNLYLLWKAYENIIYRFGYGEFISERNLMWKYSIPVSLFEDLDFDQFFLSLHNRMGLSYGYLKEEELNKYNKSIDGKTIEVRSPNGSLNPIIWQNNVNFFARLMLYTKSDKFNMDLILKRLNVMKKKSLVYNMNLDFFKLVDFEGAIELADLIFDKNIDKVYFLRQYLKNEEVGVKVLEKGTKFTKCKNY